LISNSTLNRKCNKETHSHLLLLDSFSLNSFSFLSADSKYGAMQVCVFVCTVPVRFGPDITIRLPPIQKHLPRESVVLRLLSTEMIFSF